MFLLPSLAFFWRLIVQHIQIDPSAALNARLAVLQIKEANFVHREVFLGLERIADYFCSAASSVALARQRSVSLLAQWIQLNKKARTLTRQTAVHS